MNRRQLEDLIDYLVQRVDWGFSCSNTHELTLLGAIQSVFEAAQDEAVERIDREGPLAPLTRT